MIKISASLGSWQYAIKTTGVLVCLIGAFLMAAGQPILGENHAGVATLIGIVGIGLISTSNKIIGQEKARRKS